MPVMKQVLRTYKDPETGQKRTDVVEMFSVDAFEAVRNHPGEYSWPKVEKPKEQKTAADGVTAVLAENAKRHEEALKKQQDEIDALKKQLAEQASNDNTPPEKDADEGAADGKGKSEDKKT